jgi:hypothetical protein
MVARTTHGGRKRCYWRQCGRRATDIVSFVAPNLLARQPERRYCTVHADEVCRAPGTKRRPISHPHGKREAGAR